MNQKIKHIIIWKVILAFIVICMLTIIWSKGVTGGEKAKLTKEQYESLELASVQEIRNVLDTHYLSNSGIMLTKTMEQGNICVYEIQIHHKGLEHFDSRQKEELFQSIASQLSGIWNMDGADMDNIDVRTEAGSDMFLSYELI